METSTGETADCQEDDVVLSDGWKAVLVENNRWFYLHETKKNCCWLPPVQSWQSRHGLPYGWELAQNNDGRRYYINHLTKETSGCLPLSTDGTLMPPRTRTVVISRHSDIGYGFVAGSEKPVLIRSVAEDGPSAGKLHANDQILRINGEDVYDLPQSEVIFRIKQYAHELCLEVIANDDVQDVKNRGQRKSSIMSRTTRERRRSNPVNVRFAETPVLVQYVGSPPLPHRLSSLPLIPNVLKVFLENGQTRSFLYNSTTTIKDLFFSLCEKIGLKKVDRFSLVLQATQTLNSSFVQLNERACQIFTKRGCTSSTWLCKLYLVFVPKDMHLLYKEDPVAFDYFFKQMCSQVVEGRFGWELKYETAIRLAALHLQQYAMEDKVCKTGKISVRAIEKEVGGLDSFVPAAILNTMQKKDLQRVLSQQIKQTRNLCPPGQKYISPLQAKLQYLKICGEMKTYGGKQFNAIIVDPTEDPQFSQDQKLTSVIFIGPNAGLSQVTNPRSFSLQKMADFNQMNGLVVTPHTEGKQNLKLFLTTGKSITLIMGPIFETRDLVYLISGYCKYLVENARPLSIIDMTNIGSIEKPSDEVPPYSEVHRVKTDTWSYKETREEDVEDLKEIDFLQKPEFKGSMLYSIVNGSKVPPSSSKQQVCNGGVKTNLKLLLNNNPSLDGIEEESLPCREKVRKAKALVDTPEIVNNFDGKGVKKNSLVRLSEDLASTSTDEEGPEDSHIESDEKEIVSPSKECLLVTPDAVPTTEADMGTLSVSEQSAADFGNTNLPDSSDVGKSSQDSEREESSLPNNEYMTSLADINHRTIDTVATNSEVEDLHETSTNPEKLAVGDDHVRSLQNNGLKNSVAHVDETSVTLANVPSITEAKADTSRTSSLESSPDYSSDDSTVSVENRCIRSPGSSFCRPHSAILLATSSKSNGIRTSEEQGDASTTEGSSYAPSEMKADEKERSDDNTDSNAVMVEATSPTIEQNSCGQPAKAEDDVFDIDVRTSTESSNTTSDQKEQNRLLSDDAKHSKENGRYHVRPGSSKLRRRVSSGYIPSVANGDIHSNMFTPECIILDDVTGDETHGRLLKENGRGSPNYAHITSRAKACDHVLKVLYTLKTKLNSLIHDNHSLRRTNTALRTRKQFMIDKLGILEECAKQIERLSTTEEKKIIEAVLRMSSALSLLTDSCAVLYNAQYSMRHFTTELVDVVDKHIDVLITTDAWTSATLSDLTAELHKDKCEVVHGSLRSLRKIINSL